MPPGCCEAEEQLGVRAFRPLQSCASVGVLGFELMQRMVANGAISHAVEAFGHLHEILEFHSDVEPIEHMLCFGCQLMMNCAQASGSISENGCHTIAV